MDTRTLHNWAVMVTSPNGRIMHRLTYYLRSEAEGALAYYETLGWTGAVRLIDR